MKNIKFGFKFFITFGIIIILILANLIRLNTTLNNVAKEADLNIEVAKFVDQIHHAYILHLEWGREVDKAIISKDYSRLHTVEGNSHQCDFGQWYYSEEKQKIEKLYPEFSSLFSEIEIPHENLHSSVINLKQIADKNDTLIHEKILEIYNNETKPNLDDIIEVFDKIEKKTDLIVVSNETVLKSINSSKRFSLILGMIIIIISIIIAVLISQNIVKSLNKSIKYADIISKGDLTREIDIDQKDEVGILAKALNKMTKEVSKIISTVKESSKQITSGSLEMSSSSQQLSQGANEQASSIEEISSSIEQMTASINQNTQQAQRSEQASKKAADEIRLSTDTVIQSINAMKNIAKRISVIQDIADKTDLLAINAAVEAARAGEQGRGFAVVAVEIRKLAENTQKAAKEIEQLSDESVKVADIAGLKLQEVVPKILNSAKMIKEIAKASMEQNLSINEVNNSIQQFNNTVQQNAAASEELSSNIQELTAQSEQLLSVVSLFKVNG